MQYLLICKISFKVGYDFCVTNCIPNELIPQGYLVEPGYVDLSGVKFITDDIEKSYTPQYLDDDGVNLVDTDDSVTDEQDHKNNVDKTKTTNTPTVAPTGASTTRAPHINWAAKKKKKAAEKAAKGENNGGSNRNLDGIEPGASTVSFIFSNVFLYFTCLSFTHCILIVLFYLKSQ